jgi:hypothetical protein
MERTIDDLDKHITEAFLLLKGARQIAERNPSAASQRTVEDCQADLDYLLDIKFEYSPAPLTGSENSHG